MRTSTIAIGALLTGILAALARIVLAFFPLSNLLAVIMFVVLGAAFALIARERSWLWALFIAAPTALFAARTMWSVPASNLEQGVGSGWLLAALLSPLAALVGAFVGSKLAPGKPAHN